MEWYTRSQGNTESIIARVCFLEKSLFCFILLLELWTSCAKVSAHSSSWGGQAVADGWGVTLAGQRSRPHWPALHLLLCQSTRGNVTLGESWRAKSLQSWEGNCRISLPCPCWMRQLQELSGHGKQPVFLSCFLHPWSTFLLSPLQFHEKL